jgi:hypothetical protein
MAEQLLTGSIQAPGFSGLNTQDSSVQLTSGYALEAFNCVIDKYGRIGARKGWTKVNTTAISSTPAVRTVFELVKSDGNVVFSAAGNKIYTGTTTLTAAVDGTVTNSSGSGTVAYTISDDNWQVASMPYNNSGNTSAHAIFAQGGHPTLVYHKLPSPGSGATLTVSSVNGSGHITGITVTNGGTNWYVGETATVTGGSGSGATFTVSTVSGTTITGVSITTVGSGYTVGNVLTLVDTSPKHNHTGAYGFQRLGDIATLPTGYTATSFTPNCAMTAYGRLWTANITGDNQTVYFSDLQNPANFTTGTSGYLDISTVIPTGDGITALAAHNGFLIIFCSRSILIYANPKDPSTMTLQDVIKGVGCIARDSVVSVFGSDIMFLSETGVQSLGRLIQEKSMPLRDVSKNVRDDLIANVATETLKNIKAVYFATDAFYLLSLPSTGFTYCFDTRGMLENGAARTTIWKSINPTAFHVTEDRKMYVGQKGYIGNYTGYQDNATSYRWSYYTNYFDFEQPTAIKILKKLGMVVIGGGSQVIAIKWGFDYTNNYNSSVIVLDPIAVAEYGIAEYGIAEYANGIALDTLKFNASGSGRVLQIGFESDINGSPLSVQKVDVAIKTGKNI